MKIRIQNLGVIKQAKFEMSDLTIICGENNTGKTYATYALFGFISFWKEVFTIPVENKVIKTLLDKGSARIPLNKLINKRNEILRKASEEYTRLLPRVFAANSKNFKETKVIFELDDPKNNPDVSLDMKFGTAKKQLFRIHKTKRSKTLDVTLLVRKGLEEVDKDAIERAIGDALQEVLFGHLFPNSFIASAERTGAAIFRKELNFARNRLLEEVSKMEDDINPFKLINRAYSDYAMPVKENVDFIRSLENIAKQESFISKEHPEIIDTFSDIIGGSYKITSNDELYYTPLKNKRLRLTMDESSSAVRSLLDIGFYLKHVAQPGDLLIMDEPELNLHPENQRRVARLLSRLVNLGIKVFITTHSDYVIKELNTLIMMNSESSAIKHIRKEEKYSAEETISADKIKVFIAEKELLMIPGASKRMRYNTLVPADIDPTLGIEARSFDNTIEDMNRIQEILYFASEEAAE